MEGVPARLHIGFTRCPWGLVIEVFIAHPGYVHGLVECFSESVSLEMFTDGRWGFCESVYGSLIFI